MPDTAEICGCNGVCKGDIVKAITKKNLFTLDEVRAHTKASSSCGSCTGLVEQLLANTLGGDYSEAPAKKPMCPCTIYTHEEVRAAIVREKLKSIPAAMQFLEWKTPDGCHKCRPGLNFYLLCAWPGEYQDDKQSRFINERAHGNIQRDGTYSVVPRMWGGVTSAKELRAIADVAEKYAVPTVKVTGGQRIDLLGVKKEDLPNVWRDLSAAGFVSGHAYGKALRTVKTCVGKEWCRFGTQDSTGLGIRARARDVGLVASAQGQARGVGLPAQLRRSDDQGLGVVCVDSGYELHVGGNGGIKIRATDFLCKVATEEEVVEYCCAYLQLYREEARYLERTAPWIERVGPHARARAHRRRRGSAQGALRAVPRIAEVLADGPVGRARGRHASRGVRAAASRARRAGARRRELGRLGAADGAARSAARAACASAAWRSRCSARARARCSRCAINARIAAGRCRKASCTARA